MCIHFLVTSLCVNDQSYLMPNDANNMKQERVALQERKEAILLQATDNLYDIARVR